MSKFECFLKGSIMKTKLYFLTPLLLFALSACNSDDPSSSETDVPAAKERQDIPLTRSETQLADHTLDFSLALLRQASLQEAGKNMLVSPLGTAALLNLMANGAESHTADELYAVLSPSGVSAGELNDFFSKLNTWLPELDNTTSLAQAYSLWMDDQFTVHSGYTDVAQSVLGADVRQLDFQNTQSQQQLYDWCSEKTEGCIREIDCPLADAQLVMLHALYFKGVWTDKFDPAQTRTETFRGSLREVAVPMMHDRQRAGYAVTESVTAVSLPYGNEAYSMLLVLPAAGTDMAQAGRALADGAWKELTSRLYGAQVDLKLPKFELAYDTSLIEMLQEMGIHDAFNGEADFSGLTPDPLYFNVFKQQSVLRVDERGTEAASVTWAGLDTSLPEGGEEPVAAVTFDRPFYFFIQEKSTGLMLFMGKVEELNPE